ncbi:c-type cytochrome [Maliponia aquimaris]|uniref:Cytochrome c4 n=1 Tax=Maliponia aquimaris TaxID=1673631 RepID=A0A238KIX9_9RHOB|nr:c-type cytochrome [Maliponia aquimaris]SMX42624.1 Cytochrome c4 precursor [Maliponia aquimaris]
MRLALVIALGGLTLAGGTLAQEAGDPEAGRKVANMCRTCHGLDGYAKIPIAPHIGGEQAGYIVHQLTAFRSGERQHEMMSVVAGGLSDTQIADVAAWYASHTAVATLNADPAGAPEGCVDCHGADGIAVFPDAPNLAGETNIYIVTQLKAFRTGKRTHEIMSDIASGLTDDEMRAAGDWYAAVMLDIRKDN